MISVHCIYIQYCTVASVNVRCKILNRMCKTVSCNIFVVIVAGVFHDTFHSLSHVVPQVLYPVPDCLSAVDQSKHSLVPADVRTMFLSINRYERKKNIALALEALGLSFYHVPRSVQFVLSALSLGW